jgi:hypothetical protein
MRIMVLALVALAAACSGGDSAVATSIGAGGMTQTAAGALLTVSDIGDVGGDTGGLGVFVSDRRAEAEAVNPAQVENIESWYAVAFQQGSAGPALFFSIIDFDSTQSAQSHMDRVESGQGYTPIKPPISDRATIAIPREAGIGSALIFASGDRVVLIHTTLGHGNATLADAAQVTALARLVAGRL